MAERGKGKSLLTPISLTPIVKVLSMGKNRGKQVDALLTKIEEKVNALLSKGLDEEKKNMSKNPIGKILLLGPGDSGKTTVLKQMKILHGDGFSDKDRREFKVKVYENIINAMKSIVMFAQYNGVDIENPSVSANGGGEGGDIGSW